MKDKIIDIVGEHGWITLFITNVIIIILGKFDLMTTVFGKVICGVCLLVDVIIVIVAFICMLKAFGIKFRKD